jgi:hypothetical protein
MADEVIVVFGAEVDGYNAQIKSAIGANDKLEKSADETSAKISKDFANSGKAIQQAFAGKEVAKSLDTTKKAAEQLKAQIKALYDEEVKLLKVSKNVATDGVAAIRKEAALLRTALENVKKGINDTGTELEKSAKKGLTLTAQLKDLKNQINQLDAAGQGGSKAFTDLTIQAAKLEDQIGDTRERVRVLASDTFKFDAAVQGVQAVAGAFAGAQGAIALFGGESEEVNKALLKVQASLALVAAAQEFATLVTGQSSLKLAIETAGQKFYALALTGSTGALKIFTSALALTGIGAAAVAIGILIKLYTDFTSATEASSAGLRSLIKANEDLVKRGVELQEDLDLALGRISQRQIDRNILQRKFVQETTQLQIANNKKLLENEEATAKARQLIVAAGITGFLAPAIQAKFQADIKQLEKERLEITKEGEKALLLSRKNYGLELQTLIAGENKEDKEAADAKAKEAKDNAKAISESKIKIKEQENIDIFKLLEEEFAAQLRTQAIIAETAVIKDNSIKNQTDVILANLDIQTNALEENFQNDEEREAERVRLVTEAQAKITALGKTGVEENKDNNKAKLESDEEYTTASIGLAERLAKEKADIEKTQLELGIQNVNATFDFINSLSDARIAKLEENAATEIALAGDDAEKKKGIERKLADEVAKIKRAQAVADKAQALFNIAISTAQNIAKGPAPLIPFYIALGAIQAAAVAARPIPKFEKGGIVKGPRHYQGGVLAELEGDEYITNRVATRKNRGLLEAINSGKEKEFIYKKFQVPIIQASQSAAINQKLNAKLDSARMERELQLNRKSETKNADKIIKAVTNNKSPRYNWN